MRNVVIGVLLSFVMSFAFATPQDVARTLFPKTVMIITGDKDGTPLAIGSGFVLKPGFIVSNFHVIEGSSSGFVKTVGDTKKYKVLGVAAKDTVRDLVILAVEGLDVGESTLSQRPNVEVGETVFAIGNPRGLEGTFSQGIVSSVRIFDDLTLLQITAPISPGSSGGPIVDDKGEIVAVAVATFRGGQNLNFAIPVKYVTELVTHIDNPGPLSNAKPDKGSSSLFSKIDSGKSTDGVSVGTFLWESPAAGVTLGTNGDFTVSLKNNLETAIVNVTVLVVFHGKTDEVVDFVLVTYPGAIPAGLAKRSPGQVDSSVKRLTTPVAKTNQFMYAEEPTTKVEYRVLGFDLAKD
jgi:S1-C subfamily serine protease